MADEKHIVMLASFFLYGTLMEPRVVSSLIGRKPTYEKATVSGFHRYRIRDRVYPGIRPKKDSFVDGVVLDISTAEERIFDLFEDSDYYKERVFVTLENGASISCTTYVWRADLADLLYDTWQFEEHFLPHVDDYLSMCQDFKEEIDPEVSNKIKHY